MFREKNVAENINISSMIIEWCQLFKTSLRFLQIEPETMSIFPVRYRLLCTCRRIQTFLTSSSFS